MYRTIYHQINRIIECLNKDRDKQNQDKFQKKMSQFISKLVLFQNLMIENNFKMTGKQVEFIKRI
jgi:hypothetical protein